MNPNAGVPPRLLLIDDHQADVALVRELLARSDGWDADVTAVRTMAEARSELLGAGCDCVVLDPTLPDATGLAAIAGTLEAAPDVPVVVLGDRIDEQATSAALKAGAQDYLVKGELDASTLWRAIHHAIERTRAALATRQPLHDPVTGLPSRALLIDHLQRGIAGLKRLNRSLAVMSLALDQVDPPVAGVPPVAGIGPAARDEILVEAARRMERVVRPSDLVARGDEGFLVLCEQVDSEGNALAVAQRLQGALSVDFSVGGALVHVGTGVGVVATRDPAAEPEHLLRDAQAAMARALARGPDQCELFDAATRDALRDRFLAEEDLRRAVADAEFLVLYQPVVSLSDGQPVGAEALLRWRRPSGDVVAPADFLELADETGLITPIGDFVLRSACDQLGRWNQDVAPGRTPPTLNINLSARQMADPGFIDRIERILKVSQVDPVQVCVDVTELELMQAAFLLGESASLDRLNALKALGVTMCIDDFGTDYSSLSNLTKFPVDVVKLDRSCTGGLDLYQRDTAMVETVVALCRALGLVVVAVGVETSAQADRLRALGCPRAQGFLYGRPAPQPDLFSKPNDGFGVA